MHIQLTPQQQQALDRQETSLPRAIDPRTNTAMSWSGRRIMPLSRSFWRKRSVSRRFMPWPYETPLAV